MIAAGAYVDILPARSETPALLVCDHGGHETPPALNRLGLSEAEITDHIGWDPGAAALTRALQGRLGLGAVINRASRLLIDANRDPACPTAIRVISEDVIVPGNRDLDAAARAARKAAFFDPYHDAVTAALAALGPCPAVIAPHSFTPVFKSVRRTVEIGVLWDRDDRIAAPLLAALDAQGFQIGDNRPYSGRDAWGWTIETHATPHGRPNVLLELRNDLIADEAGVARIADALAQALAPILMDAALYRPWRGAGAAPSAGDREEGERHDATGRCNARKA